MDRQTTILDDTAALQLGKPQAAKGKGKAKTGQKPKGTPGASALTKTVVAKPKPAVAKPKPAKKQKSAADGPKFYEADGLKINLYERSGRKRAHARLATALRKKTEDDLLAIVEDYAGAAKSREFKRAGRRKLEIAEWIEAKETLALGVHPESTLVVEEAESSGINEPNISLDVPPVNSGKKRSSPEEELASQPPTKQQKLDPPPKPKQTEAPNKQDPPKKPQATILKPQNPSHNTQVDGPMQEAPAIAPQQITTPEHDPTSLVQEFMTSVGLDPSRLETTTKVVQLPAERGHVVLTAYQSENALGTTTAFHSTTIPPGFLGDANPRKRRPAPTFLKPGRHGAGGDFDHDPDRATGRGHGYNPVDAREYQEYMDFKHRFYEHFPGYPKLKMGEVMDEDVRKAWQEWQVWYNKLVVNYPGRRADQWVCGCSKAEEARGSGWEEGDSEAE